MPWLRWWITTTGWPVSPWATLNFFELQLHWSGLKKGQRDWNLPQIYSKWLPIKANCLYITFWPSAFRAALWSACPHCSMTLSYLTVSCSWHHPANGWYICIHHTAPLFAVCFAFQLSLRQTHFMAQTSNFPSHVVEEGKVEIVWIINVI